MNRTWTNVETNLWHVSGMEKNYLSTCGVSAVEWGESVRECAYCGSEIAALKCPNCGASKGRTAFRSEVVRLVIDGHLQQVGLLTAVGTGDVFEVHYACCGPRNDYENGKVIMRFYDLRIERIEVAEPVAIVPDNGDVLRMRLTLGCVGELLLDEGDWQ